MKTRYGKVVRYWILDIIWIQAFSWVFDIREAKVSCQLQGLSFGENLKAMHLLFDDDFFITNGTMHEGVGHWVQHSP